MPTWDLFISHASEDKDLLVRPLAERLRNLGLAVAYDEFTFRLGDSLVESIDRGIANSRAGVVVLSDHFFVKPWPQHEKNGLVNRLVQESGYDLIPVWHGVNRDAVARFSPTLADRIALNTATQTVDEIALRIAEHVRPDIFRALARRLAFERAKATATVEMIPLDELKPGPLRHDSLPTSYVTRLRLIVGVFEPINGITLDELLDLYRRDLYPDIELKVWERMAATYLETCRGLDPSDERRAAVYQALLALSLSYAGGAEAISKLDHEVARALLGSLAWRPPWEPSAE